jgi:hypothetical protein
LWKTGPTVDTWYVSWYENVDGRRVCRKRRIGTVRELPHRQDAERPFSSLAPINSEAQLPNTVAESITHYKKHEQRKGAISARTPARSMRASSGCMYSPMGERHTRARRPVPWKNGLRSLDCALSTKSRSFVQFWWAQQDSNLRLPPCEGGTLPLSYAPGPLSGVSHKRETNKNEDIILQAGAASSLDDLKQVRGNVTRMTANLPQRKDCRREQKKSSSRKLVV